MKLAPHCPVKYGFDAEKPPAVPNDNADSVVTGHFTASFDKRLWMFHRRWEPAPNTSIRATLMIVHGTVDHSGAYKELARNLTAEGIAVVAMDMRGWGLSDGESMYVPDMNAFVEDVAHLYREIHALPRYTNVKPRFLLGKSLGGTVAAFTVATHPELWTGLAGLSGAFALNPTIREPPSIVLTVLGLLANVYPKMPFKTLFDEKLIVSDPKALEAWRDDPLCCSYNCC